jgi:hypothetical protein
LLRPLLALRLRLSLLPQSQSPHRSPHCPPRCPHPCLSS